MVDHLRAIRRLRGWVLALFFGGRTRSRKGLERANEAREKARTIAEGLAEGQ